MVLFKGQNIFNLSLYVYFEFFIPFINSICILSVHKQRWNIFNNQARIYIGGMKRNKGRLEKTFHGTISGKYYVSYSEQI